MGHDQRFDVIPQGWVVCTSPVKERTTVARFDFQSIVEDFLDLTPSISGHLSLSM
jgi:hypothetical protein